MDQQTGIMSDWPKHRNVKASKNIYKLSDWPKNRDAYASKNILENIKDHLINFLCKVPVNDIWWGAKVLQSPV